MSSRCSLTANMYRKKMMQLYVCNNRVISSSLSAVREHAIDRKYQRDRRSSRDENERFSQRARFEPNDTVTKLHSLANDIQLLQSCSNSQH